MSLNRVSLIGHVGKAPQYYQTDEGDVYACFSLATQEHWKDSKGQKQACTEWHPIVVLSKYLVETLRQHVSKGAYVFVEGKLNHRTIFTEDGREQRATEVLLKDYRGTLRILNKGQESLRASAVHDQDDESISQNNSEDVSCIA